MFFWRNELLVCIGSTVDVLCHICFILLHDPKGIPGGDAGELVAEACLHGTAHPPGYPLFSMLTSLSIKLLPFQPAVSANLMSAFLGLGLVSLFLRASLLLLPSTISIACPGTSWAA